MLLSIFIAVGFIGISKAGKSKSEEGYGSRWLKNCGPNQVLAVMAMGKNFMITQCGLPRICDEFLSCNAAGCNGPRTFVRWGKEIGKSTHGSVDRRCCQYEHPKNQDQVYESCGVQVVKHRRRHKADLMKIDNPMVNPNPELLIKEIARVSKGYRIKFCKLTCSKTTTRRPSTPRPRTLPRDIFNEKEFNEFMEENAQASNSGYANAAAASAAIRKSKKGSSNNSGKKSGESEKTASKSKSKTKSKSNESSEKKSEEQNSNEDSNDFNSETGEGLPGGLCFASDQEVITPDGPVRMDKLKEGDLVLSQSHLVGYPVFERVDWFLHREPDRWANFLTLRAEGGKAIKLTDKHLLPVVPCDYDRYSMADRYINQYLKKAEDAKVGECLMVNDPTKPIQRIAEISASREKGIYSPFTSHGTLVVNGIHASCHSAVCNESLFQTSIINIIVPIYRRIQGLLGRYQHAVGDIPGFVKILIEVTTVL